MLPAHRYRRLAHVANDDDASHKCLICQIEYEQDDSLVTLTCFHMFHYDCAKNWFEVQNFCPICRQVIDA